MSENTDLVREHLETSKQRFRTYREAGYFAITVLIGLMLIWALWSWRNANNIAGASSAKLNIALDELTGTIQEVRAVAKGSRDTVEGLTRVENELVGFVGDARIELRSISFSVQQRMLTLDTNLVASRNLIEEGTKQLNNNGTALTGVILHVDRAIEETTPHLQGAVMALERGSKGFSTLVEATTPQVAELLSNLNAVVIDSDGLIKAYTPIGTNLSGVTEDLHGISTDTRKFIHDSFYPVPVHGFWNKTWRAVKYILEPAYQFGKLYFILKRVP
jgi:ABC-type transporter Mla subunit MlaD